MRKALSDIPIGKQIGTSYPEGPWNVVPNGSPSLEPFHEYNLRDSTGWKSYDYNHVLKPEHRANGYSLTIYNDNPSRLKKAVVAVLKHKDKKIGHAVGLMNYDKPEVELGTEHPTEIFSPLHLGKGLGVAMYEGIMSHAKNALGAQKAKGYEHSTSASNVHAAISRKHGMDYQPERSSYHTPISPHDNRYRQYEYILKAENMQKALIDIPVGKRIGSSPPTGNWDELRDKSFEELSGRKKGTWKSYDYSHTLQPELQSNGYNLTVHHDIPHYLNNSDMMEPHSRAVVAVVSCNGQKVGHTVGFLNPKGNLELGTYVASEVDPNHRGHKLGTSMYESLLGHAKNVLKAKSVNGEEHSTAASKIHSALSAKHGLEYVPHPRNTASKIGDFDAKFNRYQYALKTENMNKALADIPVGKEISSTPPREHWSPLTTNNFAQMTGRSSKGWKGYDYSHVLKPELREKGYTLSIHHDNPHENVGDKRFYKKALVATVKHKGKKIGNTVGYLHDNGNLELATEFASHINPLHRGKGLGVSMYEGVMSHAKNALNGKQVVGGVHSTMASKVHGALAKKHGLEYNPTAQVNDKPTGEYDDKFGAYNYALKSEELNKALADIPVGKKISDKENNYDHVLSPEHRKEGYSLNVLNDNGKLFSVLKHNGKAIGNVYGSHHGSNTLDLSSGFASHIAPEHQNKGLGKAIYEALLSHAHNGMGIDKVVGGKHSTSASKVHSALAAKHGLGYIPESNSEATMSDTEYNQKVPKSLSSFTSNVKYGPYSYMLKSEQSRVLSQIRNITSLLKTLQTVQPDHTIPSEPGYSYHITNADNLHSIADSGLGTFKPWHGSEQNSWPDGATEKRNYFHSNIQGTLPFGSGTKNAILRVNQNAHPVKKERGTGDLYSRKTVHPDNIELLTEHGWHPITKWSQDKIKPQIQLNFPFAKSLSKSSVEDTMHEFKEGTLHSGSKSGPKVTDKDQAVAIALNQNKKSEHMWRTRPILKSKDADDLDQSAAAYAIKLGDVKRAEDTAYNEYERNHRLDAAAHHYKALGIALAKSHRKAADHHRLAYQGHCQALGINGLESAPRVIMERVRQLTDNEPDRFKSHPADIF